MKIANIAIALTLTLAGIPCHAADIIIESRSGGKNFDAYKETAGKWLDSNNPAVTAKSTAEGLSPQTLGSRKTAARKDDFGDKSEIVASARFTPKIETPGPYHIYVTFPTSANATPVTYLIKDSNGETRKDIIQYGWGVTASSNASKWIELGTFNFTPASDQYVEMIVSAATGSVDTANNPQAFADAIRFTTEPLTDSTTADSAPAPRISNFGAPKPAAAATSSTPSSAPALAATPSAPAPSSAPIAWAADLPAGRAAATSQGKKLLVFFYSPQSSRSTDYETSVLNDPSVKGLLAASFIPVKVNMDTQRDLASQMQVYRAGTVNVYDAATGNGLEVISDAPAADELIKRLDAVK